MCKTSTLKNTKHCWEKWTNKQKEWNENIYHIHELKESVFLSCQLSPNWFIVSIQSKQAFPPQTEKLILKCIWKFGKSGISKSIFLEKMNKVGRVTLADFKIYYTATVIKIGWCQLKDQHIDRWNRIESLERGQP